MVRLGYVRFIYVSFLYFITQKLGTCCIYKQAFTGMAAVPVSCANFFYHKVLVLKYNDMNLDLDLST